MDPVTVSGIFVAGIGVGLSALNWKPQKESPPLTCHCACDTKSTPVPSPVQAASLRELLLTALIGVLIGGILVACYGWRFAAVIPEPEPLCVREPSKGKGKKKGVFGSQVPLQLDL